MASPSTVQLCCGSYDRAVCGYAVDVASVDGSDVIEPLAMEKKYATAAHTAPVRCVASSGSILASAGDDEIIRLYDLAKMVEVGLLMQQEASITHMVFHDKFMLSGAEDGSICVWLIHDWSCPMTLKGHKGKLTGLSIHPTGQLALSVGQDRQMIMWDLVKGKKVLTIKVKTGSTLLQWSPTGSHYSLCDSTQCRIFDQNGALTAALPHPSRILSTCFLSPTTIVTGADDHLIRIWTDGELSHTLSSHEARVSALCKVDETMFGSASSDGQIYLWDYVKSSTPIAGGNCNLRITSLCSVSATTLPKKAKKEVKKVTVVATKGTKKSIGDPLKANNMTEKLKKPKKNKSIKKTIHK